LTAALKDAEICLPVCKTQYLLLPLAGPRL
jgi:hypothetical protein